MHFFRRRQSNTSRFDPVLETGSERFLALLNPTDPYRTWVRCWCETLLACRGMNGDARTLFVKQPASIQQVTHVERQLGQGLPASLRQVFLDFSAGFEFWWSLPDDVEPPLGISSGGFEEIGLDRLAENEKSRRSWIKSVFPNVENPYDAVWHNKLAVVSVINGDILGIDLTSADGPVIYLSHDGDTDIHGKVLGTNLADFMQRWSMLGCVGPEGWVLKPFFDEASGALNPSGSNAVTWQRWLGLTG